jgi:peroxiredoxin
MRNKRNGFMAWCGAALMCAAAGCAPNDSQPAALDATPQAEPKTTAAELHTDAAVQPPSAAGAERAATDKPHIEPPANLPSEPVAADESDAGAPRRRTAFYRADAGPAEIPPVFLSKSHETLCRVKVGDAMPEITLARIDGRGGPTSLAELSGDKATVVVFWAADRRMAREQLADMGPDVLEIFGDKGVSVVGVAVEQSREEAESALRQARAGFTNLLDAHGDAFAKVGSAKLPRTYLLDPEGKILWFDIEYSLGTRRELHQALRAVVGEPASAGE